MLFLDNWVWRHRLFHGRVVAGRTALVPRPERRPHARQRSADRGRDRRSPLGRALRSGPRPLADSGTSAFAQARATTRASRRGTMPPESAQRERSSRALALFQATTTSTLTPIERPRAWSARPELTAISASPFEFSYQKAAPGGRSPKVRARSRTRSGAASLAPRGSMAARKPVIAL